ncbi:basic blue protein-like [Gastrolobium bilobum]|uniref:basic blue protein-like n=1 Tax=Gastrolobium bilobum TaxID=150636 RepID=UPI002AB3249B|nr:basic blue protein-like [Gastrolobium bilobum]
MSRGRGSASSVIVMVTLISLLCLLVMVERHSPAAKTHIVGGPGGWTFNTDTWPIGQKFLHDDVLIFNYDPTTHNVVAVDSTGYSNCKTSPANAKVYSSGNDQIRVYRGMNCFICNFTGHCESGMKLAINAVLR